jgi:TPR repeat protein
MADLTGLNLLRNDPVLAARLIAEAEQGDMDAQYAAGLIYAEGRGVAIDLVQSYFWLTRAMDQGDADAEKLRRYVAAQMDDAEFADARRLVRLVKGLPDSTGGAGRH